MKRTLIGLYDNYGDAAATVHDLEKAGISHSEISVIASNRDSQALKDSKLGEGNDAAPAAVGIGTVGAIVGGGSGLLAGLGMLAIPGVGPVVAAGWLVATAVGAVGGAVVGAAGGGIIGSLVSNDVSKEHAQIYAEGVRRGGTIVTVRVAESEVAKIELILQEYRRVDPVARGEIYRDAGWTHFDENAPPYV